MVLVDNINRINLLDGFMGLSLEEAEE